MQLKYFRMMAHEGLLQKEVAYRCDRSPQTVRNTICELYRRIGARTDAHAVWLAIQKGWLK